MPNIPEDQLYVSLDYSATGLAHALQDVRQPAQKCIVELYRYLGDEVRNQFGNLRQAQIDQIEQLLAESGGANYVPNSGPPAAQR